MKLKPLGDRLIVRAIEERRPLRVDRPAGHAKKSPRRARSSRSATQVTRTPQAYAARRRRRRRGPLQQVRRHGIKVDGEELLVLASLTCSQDPVIPFAQENDTRYGS